MKLRIRGNSIRLRLSKEEVAQFSSTGSIEETVEFGSAEVVGQFEPTSSVSQRLMYRIRLAPDAATMNATFSNNCLCVSVPEVDGSHWANSELVGIESVQQLSDQRTLRILVEKDLA